MFGLNFDEPRVMLQTDRYRVVAIGRSGWRTDLRIELAHRDALGEVSWHELDKHTLDSNGNHIEGGSRAQPLVEALGAALEKIRTLELLIEGQRLEIEGK